MNWNDVTDENRLTNTVAMQEAVGILSGAGWNIPVQSSGPDKPASFLVYATETEQWVRVTVEVHDTFARAYKKGS